MTQTPDEPDEGPGPPPDAEVPFDPTGLDLARTIADAVAHVPTLPPARVKAKRPRRRPGSQRPRSDPTPLGEALGAVIAEEGWSTDLSVHALLGRWPSLVGPVVAEHCQPEGFAGGVLTLRADATAWASQLRLMAPQLLAKLNQAVGQGAITRLLIKGPDAPSWKHGRRSVRDGQGPRDTYG